MNRSFMQRSNNQLINYLPQQQNEDLKKMQLQLLQKHHQNQELTKKLSYSEQKIKNQAIERQIEIEESKNQIKGLEHQNHQYFKQNQKLRNHLEKTGGYRGNRMTDTKMIRSHVQISSNSVASYQKNMNQSFREINECKNCMNLQTKYNDLKKNTDEMLNIFIDIFQKYKFSLWNNLTPEQCLKSHEKLKKRMDELKLKETLNPKLYLQELWKNIQNFKNQFSKVNSNKDFINVVHEFQEIEEDLKKLAQVPFIKNIGRSDCIQKNHYHQARKSIDQIRKMIL